MSAVRTEFSANLAPALSQQLKMTPRQFSGFVSQQFPGRGGRYGRAAHRCPHSAMGTEMQTKMLPALGTQLKMSPEQLQAFRGGNFPATANALQTMPASMQRFNGLVQVFDENLGNYETLKPVGLARIVLIMMVAGGLAALLGAMSIVTSRRE